MRSASWTMSLFSLNTFAQPPATWCFSAMELRVSPLTTLYSPSPFLTFLPVGVVTVFLAAEAFDEQQRGAVHPVGERGGVGNPLALEGASKFAAVQHEVRPCARIEEIAAGDP